MDYSCLTRSDFDLDPDLRRRLRRSSFLVPTIVPTVNTEHTAMAPVRPSLDNLLK